MLGDRLDAGLGETTFLYWLSMDVNVNDYGIQMTEVTIQALNVRKNRLFITLYFSVLNAFDAICMMLFNNVQNVTTTCDMECITG